MGTDDRTVLASANRRYDFDWLRFFGAVMVVVAHCSGLFSPWAPPFGNIQKNKLFSELLWNLNLWLC
jgi:peptidoglycan/LPS O-acetylase OafA/YrhL